MTPTNKEFTGQGNQQSNTTGPILPPYTNYTNYTNGAKVCSAHEIMIKVLDKQDRKLDEIDGKLDTLLQEKAIRDKAERDHEKEDDRSWSRRDKILTTIIGGTLLTLIALIIEFNWKTFILGI